MNAGFRTFRISSVSKEYLSLKRYEDGAKITSYQNEGGIFMKRTLGTKAGFGIGALLDKLHRHLYQDPNGRDQDEIDMIIVTGDGVIVNDSYYNKERIKELVQEALDTKGRKRRVRIERTGVLSCWIPEVGKAVQRSDGSIEIGGIEIQKRSWLHHEIEKLFAEERPV